MQLTSRAETTIIMLLQSTKGQPTAKLTANATLNTVFLGRLPRQFDALGLSPWLSTCLASCATQCTQVALMTKKR